MLILLIEDDRAINQEIKQVLYDAGFVVDVAYDGIQGLEMALTKSYDAMIVDIMLPLKDGISVCSEIREHSISTPLIMLTARVELDFCLRALESGADDFMKKPFHSKELLARLNAVTRRHTSPPSEPLSFGDITINEPNLELHCKEQTARLTKTELRLLMFMTKHLNEAQTKSDIINNVWGSEGGHNENHLAVYIKHLRKKLHSLGSSTTITNIHGVGYRLDVAWPTFYIHVRLQYINTSTVLPIENIDILKDNENSHSLV